MIMIYLWMESRYLQHKHKKKNKQEINTNLNVIHCDVVDMQQRQQLVKELEQGQSIVCVNEKIIFTTKTHMREQTKKQKEIMTKALRSFF